MCCGNLLSSDNPISVAFSQLNTFRNSDEVTITGR